MPRIQGNCLLQVLLRFAELSKVIVVSAPVAHEPAHRQAFPQPRRCSTARLPEACHRQQYAAQIYHRGVVVAVMLQCFAKMALGQSVFLHLVCKGPERIPRVGKLRGDPDGLIQVGDCPLQIPLAKPSASLFENSFRAFSGIESWTEETFLKFMLARLGRKLTSTWTRFFESASPELTSTVCLCSPARGYRQ